MIDVKDLLGNTYLARLCNQDDVNNHFDLVSQHIPVDEVEEFKARMSECITAGTAHTLDGTNCFIYYMNDTEQPKFASGTVIQGTGNPLKFMALLAYVFTEVDTKTFAIRLLPHSPTFTVECKSLLTITTIKRNKIYGSPLLIRVDHIRDKVNAISDKRNKK